jgi:hypothetical protein
MFPEAYLILAQTIFGEEGDALSEFFSNWFLGLKWATCGGIGIVVVVGAGWLLHKKMNPKPPILKKNPDD